jgi:hypothetical protein
VDSLHTNKGVGRGVRAEDYMLLNKLVIFQKSSKISKDGHYMNGTLINKSMCTDRSKFHDDDDDDDLK